MAYEPTIGEIQGSNIDSGITTGTPAVNINLQQGLNAFNDAAHAKARADQDKYNLHLQQVNQFAQNHKLDFAGVMQEDIPAIQELASKYWQKVAENPKIIQQKGDDPDWLNVQAARAKSIQDNSLLAEQEKFRDQNPDLLNEDNNKIALDYRKSGLGRNANQIQWKLPVTMDIGAMAAKAIDRTGSPDQPIITRLNDPVTGKYTGALQKTEGGITYDPNKFLAVGDALYNSNQKSGDKYGHTVQQAAKDMFSMLDKEDQAVLKKKFGDDAPKEYFLQSWMSQFKEKGGKPVTAQLRDRGYEINENMDDDLEKMRIKFGYDKILKAMEGDQRMNLEYLKDKKDLEKGKFLNDFVANLVVGALPSPGDKTKSGGITNVRTITDSKGVKTDYYDAPVSAQMKDIFSKETERNGKKTKEIPDKVYVSIDGSQVVPVYLSSATSSTGARSIDLEKSTPISLDEVKTLVADRFKLTGSLEGSSEHLVKMGLGTPTLNDGNIFKYIQHRANEAPQQTGTHVEVKKSSSKQIHRGDLPSKAAAGGYTVKEYQELLKQKGIKIVD